MGVEKEGTKSEGGYVGGFFQLFDWTSKSRKKLFATKSDYQESSEQRRKIDVNLAMKQPYLVDEDEIGVWANIKGRSDHNCHASSVTDDEGWGTRAPGVVARLMGLDSLPSSSFPDPYSSPYFDTQSLHDAQHRRRNHSHRQHDQKVEGFSRNLMEPKLQNSLNRPIEKFQTEVMPPKSAKSIPVTHHKLLSPIKTPGFVPANNAAYIMEAAARMIEPGPPATSKAKTPLVASSSTVSLIVKDLKERVEDSQKGPLIGSSSLASRARDPKERREISHRTTSRLSETSQRPVESSSAKYMKGQCLNKSCNGTEPEQHSSSKNRAKSISLAIQAKVNVQRREGLRSLVDQQEENFDMKTDHQPLKATNVQKSLNKKSTGQNASASILRQNNLKQNCSVDKDKPPSKPLVSNSHGRKALNGDSSNGCHRSSNGKSIAKSKAGSKKSVVQVTDSEKEVLYTSTNNFPRKKRSTDKGWNDRVVDNLFIDNKTQKSDQTNLVSNQHHSWSEEVKKNAMDVVSFTFTTPLSRKNSSFETSEQAGLKTNGLSLERHIQRVLLDTNCTRTPVSDNVIGGDALGILLDQKLRELTYGVETSCDDSLKVRPSSSSTVPKSKDLVPVLDSVNHIPRWQQKNDQNKLFTDKLCSSRDSDISFTSFPELSSKHRLWVDKMEECKSSRQPSPTSVLEPSFSTESYESSSFSTDAAGTEGSKLVSSTEAHEVSGLTFSRKLAETELSESACCSTSKKNTGACSFMKFERSSAWELDYVNDILCNVELMYMDFTLGRSRDIVNPHLFNQLESRRGGGFFKIDGGCGGESSRMRRKVIFDCVSECLDLRCRRYVGGGYKMWSKGIAMVRRNEWLAGEVYKQISSWECMVGDDMMVDELLDGDMSSQYGQWLDFEVDTFEVGADVEDLILDSLVDDVVSDILQL